MQHNIAQIHTISGPVILSCWLHQASPRRRKSQSICLVPRQFQVGTPNRNSMEIQVSPQICLLVNQLLVIWTQGSLAEWSDQVASRWYEGETKDDAGGGGGGGWRRKHEAGRRRPQGSSAWDSNHVVTIPHFYVSNLTIHNTPYSAGRLNQITFTVITTPYNV